MGLLRARDGLLAGVELRIPEHLPGRHRVPDGDPGRSDHPGPGAAAALVLAGTAGRRHLALAFCIWLWSQAVFVIGALCPYCMVVWAAVIPMFVIVTARNIATGALPAGPGLQKFSADWWWVFIVLIYLVVLGSIIVQFPQAFTG